MKVYATLHVLNYKDAIYISLTILFILGMNVVNVSHTYTNIHHATLLGHVNSLELESLFDALARSQEGKFPSFVWHRSKILKFCIFTCQISKNNLKTDYKWVFCVEECAQRSIVWLTWNCNQSFSYIFNAAAATTEKRKKYANFSVFGCNFPHENEESNFEQFAFFVKLLGTKKKGEKKRIESREKKKKEIHFTISHFPCFSCKVIITKL